MTAQKIYLKLKSDYAILKWDSDQSFDYHRTVGNPKLDLDLVRGRDENGDHI